MNRFLLPCLVLATAIAVGASLGAQATPTPSTPAPTFRSEVYVVPIEISMFKRFPFGIKKGYKDLTADDVAVGLDGTAYPAVPVTQDPKKAGNYIISFTPPDGYRDGKAHAISVAVRWKGRGTVTFPMEQTFPISSGVATP